MRIHRAGDGEPFTGVKPSGTPLEPGIAEADAAIAAGSIDDLAKDLAAAVSGGVKTRFAHVIDAKKKADASVEAGRDHVAAYVEFMHYVERVHETATRARLEDACPRLPVASRLPGSRPGAVSVGPGASA